jgi:UDP-3-O-[3-hydroxymyristoyl] glucosamine N-acyltransferase
MVNVSISTKEYSDKLVFDVCGVSYAGNPKNNTALFVTKKVEDLVLNLKNNNNCLVFIDKDVNVPAEIEKRNLFVRCDDPQHEYALLATKIKNEIDVSNSKRNYTIINDSYCIGENVKIGCNAQISRGAFIDHDVIIGDNVIIKENVVIKNSIIGNNCVLLEGSTIGTMAPNIVSSRSKMLIPMLGKVEIKNNVVVGALSDLPCGMAGNTVINDGTIIGSKVAIGHDDIIGSNTTIVSNVCVGGYTTIGSNVYIGLGATIKNRIIIGDSAYICMGAVVIRNVKNNVKVFGNPAKEILI